MDTSTEVAVAGDEQLYQELAQFQKQWWWFMTLGVLLIICGVAAITYPLISSVGVVVVLGVLLFVSGIALLVSAFWARDWGAFLVHLLLGILYVVLGLVIMEEPGEATGVLTLLVATLFILSGIFRMVAAIALQFHEWGWVLLSGALALVLGVLVYKHYPETATWLIGVLFGVDLIFSGLVWIMFSTNIRRTRVTQL